MDELEAHIRIWEQANTMAREAMSHRWKVTTVYCTLVVAIAYYVGELSTSQSKHVPLVFVIASGASLLLYLWWQVSYGRVVAGWMERARAAESLIGERAGTARTLLEKDGAGVHGGCRPSQYCQMGVSVVVTAAVCVWVLIA